MGSDDLGIKFMYKLLSEFMYSQDEFRSNQPSLFCSKEQLLFSFPFLFAGFCHTISIVKMTHKIQYMRNTCCEFLLAKTYHNEKNRDVIRLFMISKYQIKCKVQMKLWERIYPAKIQPMKHPSQLFIVIMCLFRYQNNILQSSSGLLVSI